MTIYDYPTYEDYRAARAGAGLQVIGRDLFESLRADKQAEEDAIPAKIRQARADLGLTQAQLAALLGYGHKTRVSKLELGIERPGPAVLLLLAAYLAGYRPANWPN